MHALRIHNSLTGAKEEFVPLHPGRIGIYVCGITVYDYCHVGHATLDRRVRHGGALACARSVTT